MKVDSLHRRILDYVRTLQSYADRPWYPPLLALLAALDNFVIVIPNDGILISSSMLTPRRWLTLALNVALGSTLGALALGGVVQIHGLPWITEMYPGLIESEIWAYSLNLFGQYGLLLVFAVAITPIAQQPAVILAGLANTPLEKLALVILVGRLIKFLIMSYVGSHAPRFISRMWGVRGELKDVGIKLE